MSTETCRKILVVGATGKQGGAVVKSLLAHPPPYQHEILALTRNVESKSAQSLASQPNITVLAGNLKDAEGIFQSAGGYGSVWGVFAVTNPNMGAHSAAESSETAEGCALVDAAVKFGVSHFVLTSVDRGGDDSDQHPTKVTHFTTKHLIEARLREKCQDNAMTYTILRPVAFMDNIMPNFFGRVFAVGWAHLGSKPLQLVCVKDIGIMGANALRTPDADEYKNTAIGLAGDDLTQAQANEVMWRVLHRPMPKAPWLVGMAIHYLVADLWTMLMWFKDVGYHVDIAKCRKLNPEMRDLETWLREESGFEKWD